MIREADILFMIGAAIIIFYFILTLIKPKLFKNKKSFIKLILLNIPILFIVLAFIIYYINSYTVRSIDHVYIINQNLDSLKQAIASDTVSFHKIDSLIIEIQRHKEKLENLKKEEELLQRRIRIENINQSISDSILYQIESALKNIIVKNYYKSENRTLITRDGKRIRTADGKILVTKENIYNDIYSIDSVEILPRLKKIDFSKQNRLDKLNYYIDSLKITFTVIKNQHRAINSEPDSLVFISIYPMKDNYKNYRKITNNEDQEIFYLDSVYFADSRKNTLTIDFPNVSKTDTIIDIRFYLKRGLIGSIEIPFEE